MRRRMITSHLYSSWRGSGILLFAIIMGDFEHRS